MNDVCASASTLPKFVSVLKKLWPEIQIEPRLILGEVSRLGFGDPLPTCVARLVVGDVDRWILWPVVETGCEDECGVAPVFMVGGVRHVFPTIRLWVTTAKKKHWEYLSLDDWLCDAVKSWHFPFNVEKAKKAESALAVFERLQICRDRKGIQGQLNVINSVVRFALSGYSKYRSGGIWRATNLNLQDRGSWLRPVDESKGSKATKFHLHSMRALVITATVDRTDSFEKEPKKRREGFIKGYGIPRIVNNQWNLHWPHKEEDPTGVDPFHTSEGADCRLTLQLGKGVTLQKRKLHVPETNPRALSPSTIRLPFAGYNDPRRLLIAATMQCQAVPVREAEPPRVVADDPTGTIVGTLIDSDPPEVNLRVGYFA